MNEDLLDRWTFVHALVGLSAGLFGVSAPVALGGAAAYEVVEYAHEQPRGSAFFGSKRPESAQNVAADLAVYGLSYWLGSRSGRNTAGAIVSLGAAALLAYTLIPKG
jgi:hypothetical protein